MGDGGVACVPLQQQQRIMERFSIAETALCGGNGNSSSSGNNVFNSKPLKFGETERRKMMKPKRDEFLMKKELVKGELALEREKNSSSNSREVENGEIYGDKAAAAAAAGKEEVEEGELGTLNGEFRVEKTLRSEIEKGEFVPEKWRKGEVERGEFLPGKWRKGNVEKGEILQEKFGGRRGEYEKGDYGSWRGSKDELEKGEFIPGRWHKGELARDEYGYGKMRRPDSVKDKGWKCDNDYERTPPSGKYNNEDGFQKKDFNRSGSQHNKRFSRLEAGLDRDSRISSKIVYEENSYKNEHINGKNFERDNSSATRLKRIGADSESSERKHHEYGGGYMGSKIRRLSDDNNRSAHSENYAGRTVERSYRNSSSSSRISSSDRFSSRHYDSSLPSKVVYDKHGRSPGQSERSPRDRARYHDQRDRSPLHRERSPYDWRERSPYDRKERSPYDRKERSPYDRKESSPFDRSHRFDYRKRSPVNGQRSPLDRARPHDHRDRTPNYFDRSPLDRSRPNTHWEGGRKSSTNEKRYNQHGSKGQEEKINQRDLNSRDSHLLAKESQDRSSLLDDGVSIEKTANNQSPKPEQSQSPSANCEETPQVSGVPEELLSMEEDMDICDTPPHVTMVADSTTGKWFYLDQFGVEQGPSKLCDLRSLVEGGVLVSDHLIRHLDSDRWVTLENAASPLVAVNFPSIVSDAITQLVIPPEAPGNLLADTGDTGQSGNLLDEEGPVTSPQVMCCPHKNSPTLERLQDLHIDERVGVLLKGFTVIPGMELETVGEVLHMTFEQPEWEKWENSEGLTLHCSHIDGQYDKKLGETVRSSEITSKEVTDSRSSALPDKDYAVGCGNSDDWFSGRWSCKGGDWKRNEEASQDRFPRKKLVLNDGFPLCQMPKSGYEDPRWHRKDELYYPSLSKRLDLPSWAFSWTDENDCSSLAKSSQMKPAVVRGPKGTMLPVVRINTCVVKDHGSFVSESRARIRGRDRYSLRSARPYSASSDIPRSSAEDASSSRTVDELDSQGSRKCTAINYPKDRLCTADDLQLHLGDWYYLDGAGHERGPSSLSELQTLVDQGNIQKYSSIFRKIDNVWIPVSSAAKSSAIAVKTQEENNEASSYSFGPPPGQLPAFDEKNSVSSSFHGLHPQFIGYTCGKLHELVMKSYKSREFAAAVNEVLDPWISAKQPKKEMEKLIFNLAFNKISQSSNRFCRSEGGGGKRARMASDENDEDCEMEEDLMTAQKDDFAFEDLCDNVSFKKEDGAPSEAVMGSWGLLDGHMLARVFHFLRADLKSLAFAALTCKHWRSAVKFYKDISRQVDLSSVGPSCTDSMIWNIMNGYNREKITSMILIGCTSITSTMLEEILRSFPSLSSVDVRGCSQFGELTLKIPNVNWIKSRIWHGNNIIEDSHSKTRSLKQITEKTSAVSTSFKGVGGHMDDFDQLRDYFDSVDRRESANQLFHRSLYRRSKVFDARKSSSILSRDARLRRWTIKKSENWYKKMEEFLALGLKDIMKENTFDFFLPKVAEIEDRMKNGYYVGRGLSSVKEDISRMCRDAIKAKSRGDAGDMNHIVTLFIQLATRLEESSKSLNQRDNMMKTLKEDSPAAFGSATSKYKKKLNKVVTERKYVNRTNGTSFVNGGPDSEYASDREIRRRLSKLNRKSMDSGSETSDDINRSSENDSSESESTASDTESDLEFRSEGGTGESRVEGYTTVDDGLESMTDEREWGARMTKASLVPPVTRKYEVIDHYVIVADEEEVRRKMQVSLPEDYAEKISQQKNGIEDADMEIPEVKDYKPRKQLGDEVLEQEVYGIDPYTHNLLLDSMQEFDWPLLEKHLFIEDVLLCTLNKQVRHFTGTGNTPMVYPLQPVVEDVQRNAEEASDIRTMRMCQGLLKAITGRPDDNYVAYRKGLGVVCNKEGGFGTEDFVVEFLGEVYPTWKWFEKQDGIRSLQKNSKDPAPEFYNIYLERPKGDADGYDLVVVDAMHKANYASRICHSCRPNCEAKVTAVDGHYQIGIYAVRQIQHGEEITFDYNSVTESKEEYEASVCLCGSQVCRGSYLNLTGEGAFQKVLKESHGILDRHQLMIEACELNSVSEEDYIDLGRAGLGSCLLGGLPDWLIAYTARLVRFINFERTKLPEEILKHNLEEKRKYFADISLEVEKSDAEVQAEGVYNQRLQNLALTLDKVRYVMRCVYGDPKKAPPPLERLSPQAAVSFLWKGEGSLVKELLQCMAPHMDDSMLNDLKSKIHAHDPTGSDDIQKELQKSLLWLRDEVRNLPCTYKCRHDAAADLIHIHAYTKCFFRVREYKTITSPPVFISPLDMGPKYTDKLGGLQEYCKTYGENYCLGQLIFWHNQTYAEPDCNLARSTRGCLSLPDIGSFYAKVQIPSRQRVYGPRTVKFMLARMEKQSQRPWPKDRIWSFKSSPRVFGSPMLDSALSNSSLNKEMVHWLKNRPAIFQAMWDR